MVQDTWKKEGRAHCSEGSVTVTEKAKLEWTGDNSGGMAQSRLLSLALYLHIGEDLHDSCAQFHATVWAEISFICK